MTIDGALREGRRAFDDRAWGEAHAWLRQADQDAPLAAEDLERLAVAAHLVGEDEPSTEYWGRAHRLWLDQGEIARAVRCAFWLGMGLADQGAMARAGGWLARAGRLLDEAGLDCPERGYLMIPLGIQRIDAGDPEGAEGIFGEIASIADRFGDPDLRTFGRLGLGRALILRGDVASGVAVLDEMMVGIEAGDASPMVSGIVYCAAILICQDIFDLRRAHEWTTALDSWSSSQPDLVPFRGQCLVHRAQIMQLHGAWEDSVEEARRAMERLAGQPAVGMAYYQQAELHRVAGRFAEAGECYRQASEWGRRPQPGLALLRLASGDVAAAAAAIGRELDEADDRLSRSRMLPAYVDIMLAAAETTAARAAADELSTIAAELDMPLLHAVSNHALGSVALADGDARAAVEALRRSWAAWQELQAPYEIARVRVLLGLACHRLGDGDTAELEWRAARTTFQQLGAGPDLDRIDRLRPATAEPSAASDLSARELEVLRLTAAGMSNRDIASALVISEHTARRHLQNIFRKLGVSSRAAATAYAFQHDLV